MLKTKFVFIIEEDICLPANLDNSCYIFDNNEDAASFFDERGWSLEMTSTTCDGRRFCITNKVGVQWFGRMYTGKYI